MENTTAPPQNNPPAMDGSSAPQANGAPKSTTKSEPAEEKKLSGKELKAQKQAEKAARRAEKQPAPPPAAAGPSASTPGKKGHQRQASKGAATPLKAPAGTPKAGPSQQTTMPVRNRRGSTSAPAVKPVVAVPKPKVKHVGLFGHLYGHPRRYGIDGASKEVHPSVLALGLQMSNYEICGSTARCVAMLLAFKSVRLCRTFFQIKRTDFHKPGYTIIHHSYRPCPSPPLYPALPLSTNRIPQIMPVDKCFHGQCHPSPQRRNREC
jgi:translation initiation factor eIF-2B subunit delta